MLFSRNFAADVAVVNRSMRKIFLDVGDPHAAPPVSCIEQSRDGGNVKLLHFRICESVGICLVPKSREHD